MLKITWVLYFAPLLPIWWSYTQRKRRRHEHKLLKGLLPAAGTATAAGARPAAVLPPELEPVMRPAEIIGYLLVLAAVFVGWQIRHEQHITPEHGLGYALGIVGGAMMFVLFLYPLRKKVGMLRHLGPIAQWFRIHIVLGVIGPLLVLFHANFQLGALNSNVALFSMLLVVLSGVVRRYFYAKVYHGLCSRRATLQQQIAAAAAADHVTSDIPSQLHERLVHLERDVLEPSGSLLASALRPFILGFRTRLAYLVLTHMARLDLSADACPSATRQQRKLLYRQVARHIRSRLRKARRVAEFDFYESLLSFWYVFHYPLFVVLFVATVVHIIGVHMY